MPQWITQEDYIAQFQRILANAGDQRQLLTTYVDALTKQLSTLTEELHQETFWRVFPEILGIDAKLTLLTELVVFEDCSNEDIVQIIETDYKTYFKELCGYDLKAAPKPSMIFHLR